MQLFRLNVVISQPSESERSVGCSLHVGDIGEAVAVPTASARDHSRDGLSLASPRIWADRYFDPYFNSIFCG